MMEQQELQELLLIKTKMPPNLHIIVVVTSYIAIITSFGHLLTEVGRKNWKIVGRKYFLFACICLGIWTDEIYEAYELDSLPTVFAESDLNEATILFVPLIISFRAILLQALGASTTLASIAVISLSPAPLFVFSPKMLARIPPLIYWNCRKVAVEREEKESSSADREGRSEEWAIKLRSLSIFLTESRLLVFLANVVPLYFTICILEGFDISNGYLSILAFALVPYFVGSTLLPIIYIGKRLNLSDKDFRALRLEWLIGQPKVHPTSNDGNSSDDYFEDDISLPSSCSIFDYNDDEKASNDEQPCGLSEEGSSSGCDISTETEIEFKERDNEDGCACSWQDDEDDWYADCPRETKEFFVEITRTYKVIAKDAEQAWELANDTADGLELQTDETTCVVKNENGQRLYPIAENGVE
jgi:hypothetical protein